ncbi:alpha/beta fold hydrolase [Cupriavidus sp. AU9028]|uniref:alpha/beta fold hydrolase n=1 Tax=Cupriavidus sp. AU9028 TaxID=2871157 RepID=UPI001C93C5C5|nr:alpha/beta hydrolase [Cupriavidus sp. AU9028]MBY4899091.1 alpha/beta hydrolase [Cupriavidus sp. AU9028]
MSESRFVELDWNGRTTRIEYQWVGSENPAATTMVFLHEGLGSVAMWRAFPRQLCDAAGLRGLVYSRPGYGRSTPRQPDEAWRPDFMHRQALEVLPALLQALDIDTASHPPWLLGHSDGGSIALLHAARYAPHVAGAVVVAPHILVEDISVDSIQKARQAYLTTDLRTRLARYHDDPDSAFWGWNDIWLHPAFRDWNIEAEIGDIACPLLAVQGLDDEYGTLEQIRGIARRVPHAQLLELPACGHSPHRDQPEALLDAVSAFVRGHRAAAPQPEPAADPPITPAPGR